MKNITIKGSLIGLTAGLVATLFDSLYIVLLRETYVPYNYPFLIIVTNICFWTIVGSVSGLFVYLFARKKHNFQEKGDFYWIIFFLLPFALFYGFLGKFNPEKILHLGFDNNLNPKQILHSGFDNNLVFLWVLIFIISLIVIKTKLPKVNSSAGLFIPELFIIIALFNFCSNIAAFPAVQESFGYFFTVDFFKENAQWTLLYNRYCLLLYSAVTLLVFVFYYLISSRIQIAVRKPATAILILFLTSSVMLTVSYRTKRTAYHELYSAVSDNQNQPVPKEVSRVILIVLDTVRKRSIDNQQEMFPNLRTFARDSVVFENCITNAPWTTPSHASLFTGLAPREHGCHGILDSAPWFDGFPPTRPLGAEFTTLAELFRDNGYRTAAIISNFQALQPGYKLNQGFEIYDYSKSIGWAFEGLPFKPLLHFICFVTNFNNAYALPYRKAEDINDSVYFLLQRLASESFFLFVNYMDAHDPYLPSRPFNGFFLGSLFPHISSLAQQVGQFFHAVPKESMCCLRKSLYEGEIAYLDYHLGELFKSLKQMGIYNDALIIVTSDHGEMFCEHGQIAHKVPLYEEVARIPLYIKFPHKQITGTRKQFISLSNLYPTILSICGLPVPEGILAKPFRKTAVPVVAEFYNYDIGAHRALYEGKHKLMQYEKGREAELYDLETDPLETNNIAKIFPEITVNMEDMLTEWVKNHPPRYQAADMQKIEVSPSVKEDLKALGYMQ